MPVRTRAKPSRSGTETICDTPLRNCYKLLLTRREQRKGRHPGRGRGAGAVKQRRGAFAGMTRKKKGPGETPTPSRFASSYENYFFAAGAFLVRVRPRK